MLPARDAEAVWIAEVRCLAADTGARTLCVVRVDSALPAVAIDFAGEINALSQGGFGYCAEEKEKEGSFEARHS